MPIRPRHHVRVLRLSQQYRRRVLFIAGGVGAGLAASLFALLADKAQALFGLATAHVSWFGYVAAPIGFAVLAYATQRFAPTARGSGIPQGIAALQVKDDPHIDSLLSLPIAGAKVLLTLLALVCGASVGREGPTVQIAASVMVSLRRFVKVDKNALILGGSAAGIAAAFNAPLAGIVFSIEELSRSFESKTSGLVLTTTIIAGLTATAVTGNYTYFGFATGEMGTAADWAALIVIAIAGGSLGGLFSLFVIRFSQLRAWQDLVLRNRYPILFAFGCGVITSLCALFSGGMTFGAGYGQAYAFIHENAVAPFYFVPLKMLATAAATISGIAGGLFAPSLSIGAGLGSMIAPLFNVASIGECALLGMAAYLTGVLQSPITAVVIMAEMTDNPRMVVPLMACAFVADQVSKAICKQSLYHSLAQGFVPAKA